MSQAVADSIAKANVGAAVQKLINLNDATEVRVTVVPGQPGVYRIEATVPD